MKKARVLVVGSYATGLVMQTERLPVRGETLIGWGFRAVHGGKGSNQAVQAARLDAKVTFLVCVGRDVYGDRLESLLREEGISLAGLSRHHDLPTGVGFIVVDRAGHNLITVDLGANRALTPDVVAANSALFDTADIVLAQMEIPIETALTAMHIGHVRGKTTILNPAPAANLSAYDLSDVDYLTPNETEACVCAGQPADRLDAAVRHLQERGARNVIVTVGERGCTWYAPGGRTTAFPAFSVNAVDTVGAGDAFAGAFAVALGEGKEVEAALRFANATAALSVTKLDTVPSYHRRAEVEAFLESRL